jgi:hypothetical protein
MKEAPEVILEVANLGGPSVNTLGAVSTSNPDLARRMRDARRAP